MIKYITNDLGNSPKSQLKQIESTIFLETKSITSNPKLSTDTMNNNSPGMNSTELTTNLSKFRLTPL